MPGFNPFNVTTKRVLKKLGGDMRRYSITFDGDTTGLRTYTAPDTGLSYVGLLKNYVDPDELVTITVSIGGDTVKFNKADWRLNQSADDDSYAVIVNYQEQGILIASSGPDYFDVIADPNYNAYVSRIEFAETVIVPIDQEYLPGVCLPVVELETVIENNAVLSESDSAKLLEVFEIGTPVVIVFTMGDYRNTAVFARFTDHDNTTKAFSTTLFTGQVGLLSQASDEFTVVVQ